MRLRRHPRPASLRAALLGALRRTTLFGVFAAVGVALTTLFQATLVSDVQARGAGSPVAVDPQMAHTDALMSAYQCSTRGLGQVVPAHAIVRRTATGGVRLVSFDRGWAVYEGKVPGVELLAVCRR